MDTKMASIYTTLILACLEENPCEIIGKNATTKKNRIY